MYQVIARKYRPDSFTELISQEHVRTTLENAITQKRIAHGYILSGQRGTGKTTVARIIARCLNCVNGPTPTPCGVCSSCTEVKAGNSVDVIEIDAASNRGINEMRELRDNIRYRPARDRYKVFIVDEAHQITTEAFNALLKTLEEPPEWVVFILCTTESHKIPVTIASRCQQFSFRSVDFGELMARMRWICEREGIETDDEVLAVLAQAGEGSVRDSLSALDQAIACCGTTLRAAELRGLLGMFSLDSLHRVTDALLRADLRAMIGVVQELESNGRSLQHFCRELARYFRNLLVARIAGGGTQLIGAPLAEQARLVEIAANFTEEDLARYLQLTLDLFKEMQASLQPRLHLELGLLRLVYASRLVPIEEALGKLPKSGREIPAPSLPKAPPAPLPTPTRPICRNAGTEPRPSESGVDSLPAPEQKPEADWKNRIHQALLELGSPFTADAVEHSDVTEQKGEIVFLTPPDFKLAMGEADLLKAVQHCAGKPLRIRVQFGQPQSSAVSKPQVAEQAPASGDEVSERALAHPDVQRFQELFPGAQVRAVRNLKE